jgi:NADH:ubiquinone oxidoreductase subunit 5 (subunit L)/multisubunit Na+/H+ antiporter MnhA subunit
MGIPFMVGFYSKDYILESLFYSSYSLVYILIVYFNVFLTFIYTLRVLGYVSLSLNQSSPLLMLSHSRLIHYVIMSFLSVVSIFFPLIYSVGFDLKAIVIVPLFQTLPPLLLVVSFILYYINLYKYELRLNSSM